jgi:ribosomal protein S18 acetylase RimI-like enzyme
MIYREGTTRDLPQLKALGLNAWSQYKDALTEENWLQLLTGLNADKTYIGLLQTSTCLLAEEDNKVVAMGFLLPHGNPTPIYQSDWCYIRFLTVDTHYAGKGIGKKLAKRMIDMAKENGEQTIALHTSEMMHAARHIYESLGFEILKEIDPRFGKRYWLYTKSLTS